MRALARACAQVDPTDFDDAVDAAVAGRHGFYYSEDDPRVVGRALRWAQARNLARVELLTPDGAPELARRAALIDGAPSGPADRPDGLSSTEQDPAPEPVLSVWHVDGAEVSPVEPGPLVPPPVIPAEHWSLAALMTEAGALPIDDHGVLVAEVAGLEVARVIEGHDGPVLDIGVGQADRELSKLVYQGADPVTDLRRVIAAVNEHRLRNEHHPLQRVGRERWLRSLLLDDPGLVEATELAPLVPLRARGGLRPAVPTAAAGTTDDGRPLVVVAMVGIDLDLVPEAADYRHRHDPEAELLIVMPERDIQLSTSGLSRLRAARVQGFEGPWATVVA